MPYKPSPRWPRSDAPWWGATSAVAAELVSGDVVLVAEGDIVGADARVLEAHELSWGRGPRLVFAPESYNGEQRAPLSAETSFSFFPPFPPGVTAVFAPGE